MNHYETLQVGKNASAETIRHSYRKLVLKYHPDKNDSETAHEMFIKIQQAYEVLGNKEKRQAYDLGIAVVSQYSKTNNVQHAYFKVSSETTQIKIYNALKVTYSYAGEGRLFVKPVFDKFFVAGRPTISFVNKSKDGITYTETQITYTLYAMQTGLIQIRPATIKLNKQPFKTESICIQVETNNCAFLNYLPANGKPVATALMQAQHVRGAFVQTTTWNTFYVLTPRSKTAMYLHGFALIIKYTTAIAAVFFLKSWSLWLTIPIGIVVGYINETVYYKLAKISSMRSGVLKSDNVLKYINNHCYLKNKIDLGPKWSKTLYHFESIFN